MVQPDKGLWVIQLRAGGGGKDVFVHILPPYENAQGIAR